MGIPVNEKGMQVKVGPENHTYFDNVWIVVVWKIIAKKERERGRGHKYADVSLSH